MTTISDQDRAEAQAIFEAINGPSGLTALNDSTVLWWLAVRDHVLDAHECPTVPVWRPVTRDEIQAGWEVRARYSGGTEATWGVAHTRGGDGDWRTEWGRPLTWDTMGWTYETTAPLPEPEPDPRVRVVVKWINEAPVASLGDDVVDLLARLDALTGGEQS